MTYSAMAMAWPATSEIATASPAVTSDQEPGERAARRGCAASRPAPRARPARGGPARATGGGRQEDERPAPGRRRGTGRATARRSCRPIRAATASPGTTSDQHGPDPARIHREPRIRHAADEGDARPASRPGWRRAPRPSPPDALRRPGSATRPPARPASRRARHVDREPGRDPGHAPPDRGAEDRAPPRARRRREQQRGDPERSARQDERLEQAREHGDPRRLRHEREAPPAAT